MVDMQYKQEKTLLITTNNSYSNLSLNELPNPNPLGKPKSLCPPPKSELPKNPLLRSRLLVLRLDRLAACRKQ